MGKKSPVQDNTDGIGYEYVERESEHGLSEAYFKKMAMDKRRDNRRRYLSGLVAKLRTALYRLAIFINWWLPK